MKVHGSLTFVRRVAVSCASLYTKAKLEMQYHVICFRGGVLEKTRLEEAPFVSRSSTITTVPSEV